LHTPATDASILAIATANAMLGAMAPDTLKRLLLRATSVELAPDEVLIRQGDLSDCAYLIVEGEVTVVVNTSNGEVLVANLPTGVLVGEIGVFADLPRNATVRARTAVRALRFGRDDLRAAGDSEPALLRSVISRLGGPDQPLQLGDRALHHRRRRARARQFQCCHPRRAAPARP